MEAEGFKDRTSTTSRRPTASEQYVSTESCLWLTLSAVAFLRNPFKLSVSVALVKCLLHIVPSKTTWIKGSLDDVRKAALWRSPPSSSRALLDHQGIAMSQVLLPILLQSMADASARRSHDLEFLAMAANLTSSDVQGTRAVVLALLVSMVWLHPGDGSSLALAVPVLACCYSMNYFLLRQTPSLHGVFTKGEWDVINCLASVAVALVWVMQSTELTNNTGTVHHAVIAASGLLGCWVACATLRFLAWLRLITPWMAKLLLLALVPLAFVEVALRSLSYATIVDNYYIPDCILWLLDFLGNTEQIPKAWVGWLPHWTRFCWIIYWAVTLVLSLFFAPNVGDATSVTIARKWFHLVACLLFIPVTMAAPQLQSLAYAIALAIMMVLECLRHDLPWLNEFYLRYVDHDKDTTVNEQNQQVVIISHMALIAGCAIPLWIAEFLDKNFASQPPPQMLLLALWGVLCLGVGDAMGALVGTCMGRTRWGSGNRTVEGSLAMLGSMALPCWLLLDGDILIWISAVLFTTLIEAFTSQIDNLVLPLAGCATILLLCWR